VSAVYRLPDEPRPGAVARTSVQPVWPLFGQMLAGTWFAWPWFLWNGRAFGSPTWGREAAVVALGVVGLVAVPVAFGAASIALGLGPPAAPYLGIALTAWKLAVSYSLYALQNRTFEIYRHFGGPVANGAGLLVVGLIADRSVGRALARLSPLLEALLR
jgi:hypothetical protein